MIPECFPNVGPGQGVESVGDVERHRHDDPALPVLTILRPRVSASHVSILLPVYLVRGFNNNNAIETFLKFCSLIGLESSNGPIGAPNVIMSIALALGNLH